MCFCASASFATSGGLAIVGVASIGIAKKDARLLAAIPLLFAIQQLFEGGQWIVPHPSQESLWLGYAFLFFAFIVWPLLIPAATYQLETNKRRKSILRWFIGAGAITSLGLIVSLFTQPLAVTIIQRSVAYNVIAPFGWFGVFWYVLATCGSLLASSRAFLRWAGLVGVLSFLISTWFYFETFTSVWCFFAAILSAAIYLFLREQRKNRH